jgi:hypothetical protein
MRCDRYELLGCDWFLTSLTPCSLGMDWLPGVKLEPGPRHAKGHGMRNFSAFHHGLAGTWLKDWASGNRRASQPISDVVHRG